MLKSHWQHVIESRGIEDILPLKGALTSAFRKSRIRNEQDRLEILFEGTDGGAAGPGRTLFFKRYQKSVTV
jgi:hypothetical protein